MKLGEFDSVYRLILVASERCARIIEGEPARLQSRHIKPTYIALDEVLGDKVGFKYKKYGGDEVTVGPFPCESSSE